MAQIVQAPELSISQYVAKLGLNPENVFYQRVRSNNVTTAGAQWQITSPNKRSLLLSWAAVDWQPTIERRRLDGTTAQNFDDSGDQWSFKPLLPFSNAMTSQTVSINGNSLTLSQPRRFAESLSRMCVNKGESRTCYETQWWNGSGGSYAANRAGIHAHASAIDYGLKANETLMKGKFHDSQSPPVLTLAGLGGAAGGITVSHQEPLLVPPFNPYMKVQDDLPGYLPFGHMSPVIPNIDRIEVDIQFNPDKLAASTMFYRYAHADTDNEVKNLAITALAADLLLYWYEVPVSMSIPRSVSLQTWNLREFQDAVGQVANGGPTVSVTGQLLQLRSVPSFIILHAERNKDDAAYLCRSMVSDDDFLGTGAAGSANAAGLSVANTNHSLDTYMQIKSMNVVLGDRPNVISVQFTQRELYQLTLKNCKYEGFSLAFKDWLGTYSPHVNMAANVVDDGPLPTGAYDFQLAKSFVVLQPKDIAQKVSSGVFFPTSLQFEVNLAARDGACGLAGGNLSYTLFTHVVVGKHFLRLEPDRAQYQEQNVSFEAAEAMLQPGLVGGGGLSGGGLDSLRSRGSYRSRF